MSSMTYENEMRYRTPDGDWERRYTPDRRTHHQGASLGPPLLALAVLGLGALALYSFGPDLQRYLKMSSM